MPERVFKVPDLGEGLEEAEIVEWKVAEGESVELNQPLVEVNTAKALVEIPSPYAGTIVKLHGADGDLVKVGDPLATFDVAEQPAEEPAEGGGPKREAVLVGYGVDQEARPKRRRRLTAPGERTAPGLRADASPAPSSSPRPAGVRATPPVRRLAREKGVDLSSVAGSGPEGRITREDVLSAAGESAPSVAGEAPPKEEGGQPRGEATAKAVIAQRAGGERASDGAAAEAHHREDERIPMKGVRRLIAQKMARSWREIPHVTTLHPLDATWLEALRRELTEESGTKVSALSVLVRALVEVCRDHPRLNSTYDTEAEEIVLRRSYHVGIAADTERGLVVPVVRDADQKGIVTLAREIADVVGRTREGKAAPEELTGSTVTVTNYGAFGSQVGTPIINFPEAAILGMGAIRPQPVAADGEVEVRPGLTLALSFDHRILDGADADRAMQDLVALLESPFRLGGLPRG
jgi:pyruvate/2-oxoglutarate dehydrogenase complex dihydrolipoamide acyltransferase (E2) component